MSQNLNDLKDNAKSASLSLTYSFDYLTTNSTWDGHDIAGSINHDLFNPASKSSLTANEKTYFSAAMNLWADYSAFSVTLTTGKADINVYHATLNTSAGGYTGTFQNSTQTTANEDLSTDYDRKEIAYADTTTLTNSGYGFYSALHEIGHTLGLADLDYDTDYSIYMSVMSYNAPGNPNATVSVDHWAITPMAYDIAALVDIYGSFSRNSGNNNFYNAAALGVNGTGMTAQTIVDTGGTGDTIDLSSVSGNHVIDLREAIDESDQWTDARTTVAGHEYIYIAQGSVIENAIGGSGDDTLIGNGANNVLTGNAGNDVLTGGDGDDTMNGGDGTDTLDYSSAASGITVNLATATAQNTGGAGTDTISNIENIRGSAYADTLTGNTTHPNWFYGGAGNDTIDGGSGIYADTVDYSDALVGVTVNLTTGSASDGLGGTDTLTSIEAVRGSSFNDNLTGSAGVDTFYGTTGNDVFDGAASTDSVTYSYLDEGIVSTMSVAGWTVVKGASGALGSDTLTSIKYLHGTAYDDVFQGLAAGDSFQYQGDQGNDEYVFDLSTVTPSNTLTIHDYQGNDNITLQNFVENGLNVSGDMKLTFNVGSFSVAKYDPLISSFYVGIMGVTLQPGYSYGYVDTLTVRGQVYQITDLTAYASAQLSGWFTDDQLIYVSSNPIGYTPSNGDDAYDLSAAGAGVTMSLYGGNDDFIGTGYADRVAGDAGDDALDGGGGSDTVSYAGAVSAVTVNLSTATAQNTGGAGSDTIINFENLTGSSFNDVLTGDANANVIDGQSGDDVIEGGAGNDTIAGGDGTDTASYANAASAVTVNLATLTAQNTGGAGTDTLSGIENLRGSAYNDTLTGNNSANVLEGLAGDDTIDGSGGTDTVSYRNAASAVTVSLATASAQNTVGAGTDTITNIENILGSTYNDTLTGSSGNNVIEGAEGDDTLNGGLGTDTLSYAGASSAVAVSLAIGTAQNTLGAGTDTITAFENITGSAFNDTLTGSSAANNINGGDGNDIIEGGAGNDVLTGGNGIDTLTYVNAGAGISINLGTISGQNTGGAGTDTIATFENLVGSAFNDTLTGTVFDNLMEGGAGNDTINGNNGTDTVTYTNAASAITISLATSAAQITGGAGTDTLFSLENLIGSVFNDTLTGSNGNNVIQGGAGDDTINGNGGTDTLTYANAAGAVTVNLATVTAQNTGGAGTDTISNFEDLVGSAFNDTLTGDGNVNVIEGGAGDDILDGGSSIDTVSYATASNGVTVSLATASAQNTGGAGTDTITNFERILGSAHADTLTGTSGNNLLNGGAGNDIIEGGNGDDTMDGGDGIDTLSFATAGVGVTVGLENTFGEYTGVGNDLFTNFENLTGSAYDDTLTGTSAANTIVGGAGADVIVGGGGVDVLYGGAGADTLTGSTEGDVFMFEMASAFSAQDTITDFTYGADDKFDFHDIIDAAYDPVTMAISDFVNFTDSGSDSILSIDRDGAGATYGFVDVATLTGVTGLDETMLYNNGNLLAA